MDEDELPVEELDEELDDRTPEEIAEEDRQHEEFRAILRAMAKKLREHDAAEKAKRTELDVAELFHNCQMELRKKQAEQ